MLEGAKNYLVSVAERDVGINAYKRWQRYVEQLDDPPTDPIKENRKFVGVLYGAIQFLIPGITDSVARMWTDGLTHERMTDNPIIAMAKYGPQLLIDWASWQYFLPAVAHDPIELVVWKLGTNAATHVVIDIGEAAINKIKTFRPPSVALAA